MHFLKDLFKHSYIGFYTMIRRSVLFAMIIFILLLK